MFKVYDLTVLKLWQLKHSIPRKWNIFSLWWPQSKHKYCTLTILSIGCCNIDILISSHVDDISIIDLRHDGQRYPPVDNERRKHGVWITCPHDKICPGFCDEWTDSKQNGQSTSFIGLEIQTWWSLDERRKQPLQVEQWKWSSLRPTRQRPQPLQWNISFSVQIVQIGQ